MRTKNSRPGHTVDKLYRHSVVPKVGLYVISGDMYERKTIAIGLAAGIAAGTALGVAIENLAAGLGAGITIGIGPGLAICGLKSAGDERQDEDA